MLALAFLGIGRTWAQDGHFRVTLLVGRFGRRGQLACELLCTLLALAFTLLLAVGAYRLAALSFMLGFTMPTVLKLPVGLLQGVVFVGAVSLLIALVQDLIRILRGRLRPGHATEIWAA